MTADKSQQKESERKAMLEELWVMDYETRYMSEILRDWIPDWLPWRKKKRKRP